MRLPLFPLNTVVFPGAVVPLHVFEERYRQMVEDLLARGTARERLFGIVAIREGYEVGDHGHQSLQRVGTVLQLSEVAPLPDGRFDIEATAMQRFRIEDVDTSGPYLVAEATVLEQDRPTSDGAGALQGALRAFAAYRAALAAMRGVLEDPTLPQDPELASYALSAAVLLPLRERQELLEADSAAERLSLLAQLLQSEVSAMTALPSLPATELARSRWSPN
ncbi:MAG: LON peptidase substrate-binding domain-containing protein [Marmoricola sp.]